MFHLKKNVFLNRLEPAGIKLDSVLGGVDDRGYHPILKERIKLIQDSKFKFCHVRNKCRLFADHSFSFRLLGHSKNVFDSFPSYIIYF
jgi:hypothetical protein